MKDQVWKNLPVFVALVALSILGACKPDNRSHTNRSVSGIPLDDHQFPLTGNEINALSQAVSQLPQSHLQGIQEILTAPIKDLDPLTHTFITSKLDNGKITFYLDPSAANRKTFPYLFGGELAFQVGNNVFQKLLTSDEQDQWAQWRQKASPSFSRDAKEYFASAYSSWALVTEDSLAATSGNGPLISEFRVQQALFLATLFVDPSTRLIDYYIHDSDQFFTGITLVSIKQRFSYTTDALTIGNLVFKLTNNGTVISEIDQNGSPISQNLSIKIAQVTLNRLRNLASPSSQTQSESTVISNDVPANNIDTTAPIGTNKPGTPMGHVFEMVTSPNAPTHYVPVTSYGTQPLAIEPVLGRQSQHQQPTVEDLIRPHGSFQVIPSGK